MSSFNVQGKNAVFYILISGDWFPIFCCSVNSFNYEQEDIETTNVNSGSDSDFVPGMGKGDFSISGITRINNLDGRANVAYMLQQSVRRAIHDIQLRFTDDEASPATLIISFKAFITSTNIANERGNLSLSTINWRITGGLTFSDVIPDPAEPICEIQDPLYLDTTVDQYVVSDSHLADPTVTILQVSRSGEEYDPTTGTPSGRRYKYQSSDGSIFFDSHFPFTAGETVYVLYKKLV